MRTLQTIPRTISLLSLVYLLTMASGCADKEVRFSDSIDIDFDLCFWCDRSPDSLHLPYVSGTEVTISIYPQDEDDLDLSAAKVVVEDESILEVHDVTRYADGVHLDCSALSVGTTDIRVYESGNGDYLGKASIEVSLPTRAVLYFAGPLSVGHPAEEGLVTDHVNVLVGGTATFLARFFDGDQRLYGNSVLEVASQSTSMDAWTEQSYLFEDREWVQVTPYGQGKHVVSMSVMGQPVGSLEVYGVPEEAVESIELIEEGEHHASAEEVLTVWAVGHTSTGDDVYGIEFSWENDGDQEYGEGDLYKYEYDESNTSTLVASFDDEEASMTIHDQDGWVASTNEIGCAVQGLGEGAPTRAAGGLALLGVLTLLALIVGHRRRTDN